MVLAMVQYEHTRQGSPLTVAGAAATVSCPGGSDATACPSGC